jgi:hypothetical protein
VVVGKTFAKKGSWRRSEISMVNEWTEVNKTEWTLGSVSVLFKEPSCIYHDFQEKFILPSVRQQIYIDCLLSGTVLRTSNTVPHTYRSPFCVFWEIFQNQETGFSFLELCLITQPENALPLPNLPSLWSGNV